MKSDLPAQRIAWWTLALLIVLTPLARGSVRPWTVTAIQLVVLAAAAPIVIRALLRAQLEWIGTPLDLPLLGLAALALSTALVSVDRATSLWALAQLASYIAIYYLSVLAAIRRNHQRQLVWTLIASGAFLALLGLLTRFDLCPLPYWKLLGLELDPDRISATFANPDHLAGYMEMTLPLALSMLITRLSRPQRFLLLAAAGAIALALVLSLSRGGWIAAGAALVFLVVQLEASRRFRRKRLLTGIVVGTVLVALVVLGSSPAVERLLTIQDENQVRTIGGRIPAWQATLKMIADRPLLGFGPGTYAMAFTPYHPGGIDYRFLEAHNDYLHFIGEIGLLLIPLLLWMMCALFERGQRKLAHPSRQVRGVTLGALAGVLAMLIHSAFDFNLHMPANALAFTILAALVVSPVPINSATSNAKGRPLGSPNPARLALATDRM